VDARGFGIHFLEQGVMPVIGFFGFFAATIWLIQVLRRIGAGRDLQAAAEVHTKLIDRFGSSQELIQYMESESGKKFWRRADSGELRGRPEVPSVIGRVLMPLQIGAVMTLLGAGCCSFDIASDEDDSVLLLVELWFYAGTGFFCQRYNVVLADGWG